MAAFTMPSLGSDMEAGTLLEWLVAPGDVVEKGQIIAVVETQKGAIEIETFDAGEVTSLEVEEGAKVPVGTVLAVIGEAAAAPAPTPSPRDAVVGGGAERSEAEGGEKLPRDTAPAPTPSPRDAVVGGGAERSEAEGGPPPSPPSPPPSPPPSAPYRPSILPTPPSRDGWVRSSPAARVAAHELDVDLHDVTGTGPHGAVRRPDVEAHAAARSRPAPTPAPAPSPAPAPAPAADADPMRRAIAAAMSRANREIPHYFLSQQIDLSTALSWLQQDNLERPIAERILPAALLIKAVATALRRHPELNGTWVTSDDDPVGRFVPADGIHPGIAISLRGGGLVIPALLDADHRTLPELMAGLSDLVERARAGRLRGSELSRATLTVTNLGDTGADLVHGVIYPPQVALLGFGRIAERPVAVDGLVGARPTVIATLAADHRASDGHAGARLLTRIDRLLQKPEKLA